MGMEEIRKRMQADGNLYPTVPSDFKSRPNPAAGRSVSPPESADVSVISITSSDSPTVPMRKAGMPSRHVLDPDEEENAPSFPVARPFTAKKNQILDSDDDEDENDNAPPFPIPQPAAPPMARPIGASSKPVPPQNDRPQQSTGLAPSSFQPLSDVGNRLGALNAASAPSQKPVGFTGPPVPIARPSPPPPTMHSNQAVAAQPADDGEERFDLPQFADTGYNAFERAKSLAETEKELQDLVSTSMNDENEKPIDMTEAIVEGLGEGVRLRPHQVISRQWMKERETGKKRGGILADDMGLGKTLQTIVRIVDGRATKSDQKDGISAATLVVCPVAVISQWAAEVRKYAPGLRVIEHHGPSRTKKSEDLKRCHVVVTSYSIVKSEYEAYSDPQTVKEVKGKKAAAGKGSSKAKSNAKKLFGGNDDDSTEEDSEEEIFVAAAKGKGKKKAKPDALFRMNWFRIVLDEAHEIKNRNTKGAIACCALDAKFRWCLTGTPMQNNVEELFSLLRFLNIKPLNDWDIFNSQIAKPLKGGRTTRPMKRLHVVLKAIMLRRLKTALINGAPIVTLPPRVVETVECEFDDEEREFYSSIEARVAIKMNKFIAEGTVMSNYTTVLVLLLRLRQACNHPSLLAKEFTADKDALESKAAKSNDIGDDRDDELADMLGGLSLNKTVRDCNVCQTPLTPQNTASKDAARCTACDLQIKISNRRKSKPGSELPPDSAKIRKILEILDEIEERSNGNDKTIIFSQFTSMLDLLEPFLRGARISFTRYDGSMQKADRDWSLDKIRNKASCKVILISFKAGSTGLNLTSCNNVILVDLWWNPALEDQAFDRAHRLGQEKPVNIYKLTVPLTVEDRILQLQDAKRELTRAALSGEQIGKLQKANKLGMEELMSLFRPGRDDEDSDQD